MSLSNFLAELLRTNDCVIVPDLGGFIANYHTSGFDERGNQLTPPSKEILFSAKLRKNDGLLVNFVGEREGVGYLEARKIVSEFVSEIIYKLENGETVALEQIGTLRYDEGENILFEADQSVNLRADAFGLEAFHFPQLVGKFQQPVRNVFRDKEPEPQQRRYQAVKYILVGIPILVLLYFIPLQNILDHGESRSQTISNSASLAVSDNAVSNNAVAPSNLLSNRSDAQNETPVEVSNTEVKSDLPATVPEEEKMVPKSVQPDAPAIPNDLPVVLNGKFHVVGGCFKIRENADKLAQKLVKQGYPAQVSRHGRDFFKVTVESYQTRKEAEKGLGEILEVDPDTDYWLMADKR